MHISILEKTWVSKFHVGPKLSSRTISWKVRKGIKRWRMSDGRKSGLLRSALRSCTLSSCCNLPNYKVYGLRHLAINTRVFKMTFTDVEPCITRLEGQQGSLVIQQHRAWKFSWCRPWELKWHTAQFSDCVYFFCTVSDLKQDTKRVYGFILSLHFYHLLHSTYQTTTDLDKVTNETVIPLIVYF